MKSVTLFCLTMLLFVSSNAICDVPPLVQQAFKNTGMNNYAQWAYTRESSSEQEDDLTERFSPGQNPSWSLVAVNGRVPDKKQQKKYISYKKNNPDYDHPGDLSPDGFIRLETIQLLEEHEDYATYSFLIEDEEEPEFAKYVIGEMTIDKNTSFPYVKRVVIKNAKPFSPKFGIKVNEFESIMELAPISNVGPVFITKQTDKFRGRAIGVMKIKDVHVTRYENFKYIDN